MSISSSPRADLGRQCWRWAAREIAAGALLVIVAAGVGVPRVALAATLEGDLEFRELVEAYRGIEGLGLEERGRLARARLLRVVEQALEVGQVRGLGWAYRAAGLAGEVRSVPGDGPAAAEPKGWGPRRTGPSMAEFLAEGGPELVEELDRRRLRPEYVSPDNGLEVFDPQMPEDEALAWLLCARAEIALGERRLTDAVPRPEHAEPVSGLALADPALPEGPMLARLRQIRIERWAAHEAWLSRLEQDHDPPGGLGRKHKADDPFAPMGWPPPDHEPRPWRTAALDGRVEALTGMPVVRVREQPEAPIPRAQRQQAALAGMSAEAAQAARAALAANGVGAANGCRRIDLT